MAYTEKFMTTLRATLLLALTPLAGCGDSGSGSTGTNSGTGTTTGTTGSSSGTTEATTTSGTMSPTSSTGSTTEPATTGPGTTTTTTGSTGETTTTGETTGTTTTGETTGTTTETSETTDTTGEPVGSTCEQDSDCQLYTDCCTCDVLATDEAPPVCGIMECLVDVCSTLDIGAGKPVCRFGRCTFEKVSCNPAQVACDMAPPDCPVGQLPSVDVDCWSGQCAPVEACDWAPDCATCKADLHDPLVCVLKQDLASFHVCEPKPVGCGDVPEIDCGCGAEICEASPPYTVCGDQVPGIVCECPFC